MRLAVIPARGGSRRIPRKNIREFKGKPMMLWPIEAAQASGLFDQIVVSTDDDEIRDVANRAGCLVHRRWRDDGTRGTQEVAADVLAEHPDAAEVCVIYPCSPLLTADTLRDSHACFTGGAHYLVSYVDGQDAGCFYWGSYTAFRTRRPLDGNTRQYYVPGRFIDINTMEDWHRAESMFDALRRAPR